jgi:hypothetical protein
MTPSVPAAVLNLEARERVGFIDPFNDQEDPRKTGLKNGIRQLTNEQIVRTLTFEGCMAVDDGNYVNGCFCPLAIGAGIDRLAWAKPPTDAAVAATLHLLGYRVNNTRGIRGDFFRENRIADYRLAAQEVLDERGYKG